MRFINLKLILLGCFIGREEEPGFHFGHGIGSALSWAHPGVAQSGWNFGHGGCT